MQRSTINRIIREAESFFEANGFRLPPFARWTPDRFADLAAAAPAVVARGLGWDVTDFGRGAFERCGLTLFTLRNGSLDDLRRGAGQVYAEKAMRVGVGQVTPLHCHHTKVEDIINRGGGRLVVEVHASGPDGRPGPGRVTVVTDGQARSLASGDRVSLTPGESITLTTGVFHAFWAEGAPVLAGEVSTVNDDRHDNFFAEPLPRFPEVLEDEPPYRLLVSDYSRLPAGTPPFAR